MKLKDFLQEQLQDVQLETIKEGRNGQGDIGFYQVMSEVTLEESGVTLTQDDTIIAYAVHKGSVGVQTYDASQREIAESDFEILFQWGNCIPLVYVEKGENNGNDEQP